MILRELDPARIRKLMRILFVDDKEVTKAEALRLQGYNVFHRYDITNLAELEAGEYHLIFCDIGGVGKSFGEDEGASLIRAIKAKVPYAIVVAYSAYNYQPGSRHETTMRKIADDVIDKDASIEVYMDVIDRMGKEIFSPERCVNLLSASFGIDEAQIRKQLASGGTSKLLALGSGAKGLIEGTKTVVEIAKLLQEVGGDK